MKRPGKVEELRDQGAQPVDFSGNVSGELSGKFIGALQFLGQHFSRAFDHSERVTNLVRQSRGELA